MIRKNAQKGKQGIILIFLLTFPEVVSFGTSLDIREGQEKRIYDA